MKVICFEDNARGELLSHLGFDSAQIAAAAEEYVRSKTQHSLPPAPASATTPPPPAAAAPPTTASSFHIPGPPLSRGSDGSAQELFDAPPSGSGTGIGTDTAFSSFLPPPPLSTSKLSISQSQSQSNLSSNEYIEVSLSKLAVSSSSGPSTSITELTPSVAAATADMVAAALAGEGTCVQIDR